MDVVKTPVGNPSFLFENFHCVLLVGEISNHVTEIYIYIAKMFVFNLRELKMIRIKNTIASSLIMLVYVGVVTIRKIVLQWYICLDGHHHRTETLKTNKWNFLKTIISMLSDLFIMNSICQIFLVNGQQFYGKIKWLNGNNNYIHPIDYFYMTRNDTVCWIADEISP